MKNIFTLLATCVSLLGFSQAINDNVTMNSGDIRGVLVLENDQNPYSSNDLILTSATSNRPFLQVVEVGDSMIEIQADHNIGETATVSYVAHDASDPTLTVTASLSVNIVEVWAPNYKVLDINNVSVPASSVNSLGTVRANGPKAQVPKGSDLGTLYSTSLWLTAEDIAGGLRAAGQVYDQNDFAPGPIQSSYDPNVFTEEDAEKWNHVWKVSRAEIEDLIANYATPGYDFPADILSWPAHGDPSKGQIANLAPFVDVDGNGVYEPWFGDYPEIKGDQALYSISNDQRFDHSFTQASKMNVEIHTMTYAYDRPAGHPLHNSFFQEFTLHNRSNLTLNDFMVGTFADLDIGSGFDDQMGSNVSQSYFYAYNGDQEDEDYGVDAPVQIVQVISGLAQDSDGIDNGLDVGESESINGIGFGNNIADDERRGLDCFMNFQIGGASATQTPYHGGSMYYAMRGYFMNGTHLTYGGSGYDVTGTAIRTRFAYPGNSDPFFFGTNGVDPNYAQPGGWTAEAEGHTPTDQRGVGTTGGVTFDPWSTRKVTFHYHTAFPDAGAGDPIASAIANAEAAVETITDQFQDGSLFVYENNVTVENVTKQALELEVYPKPARDYVTIVSSEMEEDGQVLNMLGQVVMTFPVSTTKLNVSSLESGTYFVRVQTKNGVELAKMVRD